MGKLPTMVRTSRPVARSHSEMTCLHRARAEPGSSGCGRWLAETRRVSSGEKPRPRTLLRRLYSPRAPSGMTVMVRTSRPVSTSQSWIR